MFFGVIHETLRITGYRKIEGAAAQGERAAAAEPRGRSALVAVAAGFVIGAAGAAAPVSSARGAGPAASRRRAFPRRGAAPGPRMAAELPGSPKEIVTELSLAVQAALEDSRRRLEVALFPAKFD